MHTMTDVRLTAAALAAVINPLDDSPILDMWGLGCVELYQQIGEWAAVIDKVEARVAELVDKHDVGWPGVFAYEVTENVGTAIRAAILDGKGFAISEQCVKSVALELAAKFCDESPIIKGELLSWK